MMKLTWRALAVSCALASTTALAALSAGDQYLLTQVQQGGPESLRNAARAAANSGAAPEVLNAIADAAIKYMNDGTNVGVDAVSWSCKGLAAAGGKRYHTIIKTLADNNGTHRRARNHCARALSEMGGAEGEQYVVGSGKPAAAAPAPAAAKAAAPAVAAKAAAAAPAAAPSATAVAGNGQFSPITEVKVGMSQEQAFAVAGPPDSTTGHITGKAFRPFNFKGNDTHRTYGLYKGQGRIVFSNNSAYSSGMSVVEIQVNPNESGFP